MGQASAPTSISPSAPNAQGRAAEDVVLGCFGEVMAAANRLAEALHHRLPAQEGHGLGVVALQVLAESGRRGLSQVELAARLGKSASSATRLVDSLEGLGVINRTPHPNDRRVNVVVLTAEGRRVLEGIKIDLREALGPEADLTANPNHFIAQLRQVTSLCHAIEPARKGRNGAFG